jgi:glutamyl-Q tRNA(Asp) synthetase
VGRFAPSPTGDLHLGSLYAAAASYLDARAHGGRWLVRMEDVDRTREVPGAANRILRTLESFGFEWDGEVVRQSERDEPYFAALEALAARGLTFECTCSRLMLAEEERYPGHCRARVPRAGAASAIRLRVNPREVHLVDRIQGSYRQDVAAAAGDLILRRRDRLFSYLLAVVVDDAAQGVTHVVRGADLLDNTPRQIYLQQELALPTPVYAHVPVLVEADGTKLAKSARSVPLDPDRAPAQLRRVFALLGLDPPSEIGDNAVGPAWDWARTRWDVKRLASGQTLHLDRQEQSHSTIGNARLP